MGGIGPGGISGVSGNVQSPSVSGLKAAQDHAKGPSQKIAPVAPAPTVNAPADQPAPADQADSKNTTTQSTSTLATGKGKKSPQLISLSKSGTTPTILGDL